MRCEVVSDYVVALDDGRATEFSSVAGGFSVGDQVIFAYIAEPSTNDLSLFLMEHFGAAEPIMAWTSARRGFPSSVITRVGGSLISSEGRHMNFGRDSISFENSLLFRARLSLRRYYRSDWHGVVERWLMLEGADIAVQFFSLDCRQIDEAIEGVLDMFESVDMQSE